MRFYIVPLLLAFTLFSVSVCSAQEAKPAEATNKGAASQSKSDELEDVTIKGTIKQEIKTQKPLVKIEEEMVEIDMPAMETEEQLFSKTPATLEIWRETYGHILSSRQAEFPGYMGLIETPIATFQPQIKGEKIVSKWNLVITDSKGCDFKKFKGSGDKSIVVVWEGYNDKNEILNVGDMYTYVFNYTDMAGNPHTFVGRPFCVNGLVHQEKNGLFISIANKALFVEERERIKIKEDIFPMLKETADRLKDYFGLPISVIAYGDTPTKALGQAQAIAEYLANSLIIWVDQIKVAGYQAEPEKQRIDVVVQNR
ncbi:hypothetical protein HY792_07395 [Candidatus Desantisbacteria bacterium]|nr:hypothetical protein [Candidatus Desantisbacteria bacterium]